ncbi:MAG: PEP-CTERM sorting domain-containing protein [Candidatus Auribacterota bacterium]
MNKKLCMALASGLVLLSLSSAQALTVKGETAFAGVSTGTTNYVDYIYTDEGPILETTDATFNFVKGTAAEYDTGSAWHYYYQVENHHLVDIVAFSLNVFPGTVLTAGWIAAVNIDDAATFDHNGVAGDHEAAWVAGPTDPSDVLFNPSGIAPNISYDFDTPTNNLTVNEYSTVLFISCDQPAGFKFSTMQNGESYNGLLPVPRNPVPEPISMVLLASSVLGIFLRKRIS